MSRKSKKEKRRKFDVNYVAAATLRQDRPFMFRLLHNKSERKTEINEDVYFLDITSGCFDVENKKKV
jgi:hypothetical protein